MYGVMIKIQESRTDVLTTWQWCQAAFATYGHKLTFPKATDPRKTYQWRYAAQLARKLNEWGFDDDTSQAFLRFAVGYIKERRLLHKGLSAFLQANILQICYERMQKHTDGTDKRLAKLKESRTFLVNQCGDKSMPKLLLTRRSFSDYCNIVRWYESGYITKLYLALSKICTAVLTRLPLEQRTLLPASSELFCLRAEFLADVDVCEEAKAIFGDDWRGICK